MSEGTDIARMNPDQRRATDPGASIWVTASAGTGKTRVLANRIARLLLGGCKPHRILALTYTNAAAAEMAQRVRDTLARWAVCPESELSLMLNDLTGETPDRHMMARARRCFAELLASPIGLRAHTIHGFCQSLLRRFPVEAGVVPHFALIDDNTKAELLAGARSSVLSGSGDSPAGFGAEAVNAIADYVDDARALKLAEELLKEKPRLDALPADWARLHGAYCALLGADPAESERTIIEAACREEAFDGPALRRAAQVMVEMAGGHRQDWGLKMLDWLAAPVGERVRTFRHYAWLGKSPDGLVTKKMVSAWPEIGAVLVPEWHRVNEAVDRANRAALARANTGLVQFAKAVSAEVERRKGLSGYLDYADLIDKALELLSRSDARAWVLYKLDGGLDHILVDEAQDNSRAQWSIFTSLAEEMVAGAGAGAQDRQRSLFVVGDPKQSIYRFQGAAPDAFAETRGHIEAQLSQRPPENRLKPVDLSLSYRCAEPILTFVDAVLRHPELPPGAFPPDAAETGHRAHDPDSKPGLVEIWPPIGKPDKAEDDPWSLPDRYDEGERAEHRLATGLADRIAALVSDEHAPVPPGDILVLLRKRGRFAPALIRALKNRDVDVEGADRLELSGDLAVRDLLVLCDFLLQRDDDLALATVLRGPLVGLSEEALFELAHGRGGVNLWERLVAAGTEDPALAAAHAYLAELMAGIDYAGPHDFLQGILATPCPADDVSGRRALVARLGRPVNDPVDELLAQAIAFEERHAASIQGFLAWLRATDQPLKRDSSERGAGVRVMTIHGAKGLEANTVILADIDGGQRQGGEPFWIEAADGRTLPVWRPIKALSCDVVDRQAAREKRDQEAEEMRLLYVALTRAERRLYICGTGKLASGKSKRRWIDYCHEAMATLDPRRPWSFESAAVPGWTGEATTYALRDALFAAKGKEEEATRRDGLPDWAHRPAPQTAARRLVRPSRWDADEPAVASPVSGGGPGRFRRGVLMHALLEHLPPLPEARREAAGLAYLERQAGGLSAEEAAGYVAEALAVIADARFAAIFSPDALAEAPIVGEAEGMVINGQIDRMVVGESGILIVDFKTNRPPPASPEATAPAYLRQMAAYRAVLGRIYPGRPVECALLWTYGPRFMPLPGPLLDAALENSRP